MRHHPIVGTITGVFHGALDGMPARLVRRGKFAYTVALLASRDAFRKGDDIGLSPAACTIDTRTVPVHAPRQRTSRAQQPAQLPMPGPSTRRP